MAEYPLLAFWHSGERRLADICTYFEPWPDRRIFLVKGIQGEMVSYQGPPRARFSQGAGVHQVGRGRTAAQVWTYATLVAISLRRSKRSQLR